MAKKEDNTMLYVIGALAAYFIFIRPRQAAAAPGATATQIAANTQAQIASAIDQRGGPTGIKLAPPARFSPGTSQAGYMTRDGYPNPNLQPYPDPRFYGPPIVVGEDGNVLPFPGKDPGPPQPIDPSYN